jgi:hypothetical protein
MCRYLLCVAEKCQQGKFGVGFVVTQTAVTDLRVSLPPKPPPMRFVLHTSLFIGTPSVLATYTCSSSSGSGEGERRRRQRRQQQWYNLIQTSQDIIISSSSCDGWQH